MYHNTDLFRMWLGLVTFLQYMYTHRRELHEHVLFESQHWTYGVNMELQALMVLPLLLTGLRAGDKLVDPESPAAADDTPVPFTPSIAQALQTCASKADTPWLHLTGAVTGWLACRCWLFGTGWRRSGGRPVSRWTRLPLTPHLSWSVCLFSLGLSGVLMSGPTAPAA
jgi:hypothetical protein